MVQSPWISTRLVTFRLIAKEVLTGEVACCISGTT